MQNCGIADPKPSKCNLGGLKAHQSHQRQHSAICADALNSAVGAQFLMGNNAHAQHVEETGIFTSPKSLRKEGKNLKGDI
jgi:hypothetical protein